jgi:hypothetical protein
MSRFKGLRDSIQFRTLTSVLMLAAAFLCSQTAAAQDLPKAPGAQVIDLTPKPGRFTEPGVAINRANPQQVIVAYQDNVYIGYSADAGQTWTTPPDTAPPNYRVSGDVSVAYDKQGHAFVCYIAFDKLGTTNYWAHGATRNGIYVRRSLDGGATWEKQDNAVAEQPTQPGIPFEDKPVIVSDTSSGPNAGTLYVGWTRWTLEDSQILLSRSTDTGKTWSAPIEIDSHRGLPRDDNGANEGFSGVVGPDGTLYAAWSDGNHVVFTSSQDGGRSFKPAQNVIDTAPIMFDVMGTARSNGFPILDMDPKSGRLYVAWSDYRNGGVDVFCSSSSDYGKTWTPAVRVNTDPIHSGADHFFQWLAVDPSTGALYMIFYDRRNDPSDIKTIVVLARSTDGGQSFSNYAWTEKPFTPRGEAFLGDYTGIAALNGRVYGAWTEQPEGRGTIVRVGVADFGGSKP